MNEKRTAIIIGFTIFIFIFGLSIGIKTNNIDSNIASVPVPGTAHISTKTAPTRLAVKAFHAIGKALTVFNGSVVKAAGINTQQSFPTSVIFQSGKYFNSKYFRIPHLIITKHGTIVAGSDIRYNGGNDFGPINQGIARSIDGGKTWINKQVILMNNHVVANSRVMDATMIYNAKTDTIFVFGVKLDDNTAWYDKTTKKNWDMVYTTSSNDGITWSKEISIKHVIDSFPDRNIFLGGVGSGIVMNNGTIVLPIQVSNIKSLYKIQSGLIYSKDNGVTWAMSQKLVPEYSSECNLVEYTDGKLLINARSDGSGRRVLYKTNDMGTTWIPTASNNVNSPNKIIQPIGCMGSMIKVSNKILYCQPVNPIGNRANPTLMSSVDNGETWKIIASVYPAYTDGYTDLSYYKNKLYIVIEISGSIIFKDITKLYK